MQIYEVVPTMFKPNDAAQYMARCEKHGQVVTFDVICAMAGTGFDGNFMERTAERAVQEKCTDCVNERQAMATRWPEGAEL